ncbi:MAG: hypothetical protein JW881_06830 [Spirochaetales bacterium]|nr:hypothetical protein [Spirochaetales bacterium]
MFRFLPDMHPVSFFLSQTIPFILVAVLILNLVQKKYHHGWGKKRSSTLSVAILLIVFLCAAVLILRFQLTDLLLIPVSALVCMIVFTKRKVILPYTNRCRGCGAPLSIKTILFHENDYCDRCGRTIAGNDQ